jgi:hypothetical protein
VPKRPEDGNDFNDSKDLQVNGTKQKNVEIREKRSKCDSEAGTGGHPIYRSRIINQKDL